MGDDDDEEDDDDERGPPPTPPDMLILWMVRLKNKQTKKNVILHMERIYPVFTYIKITLCVLVWEEAIKWTLDCQRSTVL